MVAGLQVSYIDEGSHVTLPPVYTLGKIKIPIGMDDVPRADNLQLWPHLAGICTQEFASDVGLMLGSNVPEATEPCDVLHGNPGDPFAVKTKLGWVISGPTSRTSADGTIRMNPVKVK